MELEDTDERIEELGTRLRTRLDEIENQIRPLQNEAAKLRAQLDLVNKLLRVTKSNGTTLVSEYSSEVAKSTSAATGKTVADTVADVLAGAAQPLHISQIREGYLNTGRPIPGKGTYANLLAYMVRDPRFVRVAKGTYALSGGNASAPRRVKRRKRRNRK